MRKNYIKLTFLDKSVNYKRVDKTTTCYLTTCFNLDKLVPVLHHAGLTSTPKNIRDIMKKHGYFYDSKKDAYMALSSGSVVLDPRDVDDQEKANRIAFSKAKLNAYRKAESTLNEIYESFGKLAEFFFSSKNAISDFIADENTALGRIIETGSPKI